jgi:hypothetical protein
LPRGVRTKQINPVLRSASSHCDIVPTLYFRYNTNNKTHLTTAST